MEDEFTFSATADLYALEEMAAYNRSIASLIAKGFRSVGIHGGKILDFGAGIGTISVELRRNEGIAPLALEIDEQQASVVAARGFDVIQSLDRVPYALDGCFASNVIEHIKDDVESLKAIHSRLRVGGAIAIYVPAFSVLWTEIDEHAKHYRRYTKRSLRGVLEAAGYRVVEVSYCDSLGFFAVLLLKLLRARRKAETSAAMKVYDKAVLPLSLLFDRVGARHILGKNVFAIAVKDK
jgi:SAM-dependent methyltransferase